MSLRYLTNKARYQRSTANDDAVRRIYARGASTIPADYLICHQEADDASKHRILAKAAERRLRRKGHA